MLQSEGKTVTYVSPNSGSNDWRQFGNAKDKRSLKSVILRQGQKERIVSDIEEFISNYNFFPSKYSIRAYDLVYDMLLRISNGNFDDYELHEIETEYFENKFKYKRSSSGSIDNVGAYLLKFENLKVEELSDN